MYDEYGSRGFVPLAINLWEDMNSVVKYYARQYTFPFFRDGGTAWSLYRINGYIPLNYVIDTAQVVFGRMEGFNEVTIRNWIETNLPPTGLNDKEVVSGLRIVTFNQITSGQPVTIRFSGIPSTRVMLRVYSADGQLVRIFRSNAGDQAISWDLKNQLGQNVANGLYVCEISSGVNTIFAKISILR